jgi:hypothetical protein
MDADVVSPELALVDPELAERARRSLPEPDTLARLERRVQPPTAPARWRTAIRSSRIPRNAVLVLLGASLLLNFDLLMEGGTGEQAPDRPAKQAAVEKPARRYGVSAAQRRLVKPQTRRRGKARVRKAAKPRAAMLRWPQARSAIEYDLVIWRGHERVLDVWRQEPQLDLASLPCADARKLHAGVRYLWFAYPLLRRSGPQRFGPLLKWGVFRAGRPGACGSLGSAAG